MDTRSIAAAASVGAAYISNHEGITLNPDSIALVGGGRAISDDALRTAVYADTLIPQGWRIGILVGVGRTFDNRTCRRIDPIAGVTCSLVEIGGTTAQC